MEFRLKANVTFHADNIDGALKVLGDYYSALASGEDVKSPFECGEIEIKKTKEQRPKIPEHACIVGSRPKVKEALC